MAHLWSKRHAPDRHSRSPSKFDPKLRLEKALQLRHAACDQPVCDPEWLKLCYIVRVAASVPLGIITGVAAFDRMLVSSSRPSSSVSSWRIGDRRRHCICFC